MKVKHTASDGTTYAITDETESGIIVFDSKNGAAGKVTHYDDIREAIASFSEAVEAEAPRMIFFKLVRQAAIEGYNMKTGRKTGNEK